MRSGPATITLRLPGDADTAWQAWVVDSAGRRLRPAALQLDARTVSADGTALAYELLRL